MTLSVQELKEKIELVKTDLKKQETEKARIALSSYLDYLKYELEEAERAERFNKGA
jgi:hypothetical protein